jgi:hypothetical protein
LQNALQVEKMLRIAREGTENPHKTKQPSSEGEEVAHYLGVEAGLYVESGRRAGPNQLDFGPVIPEKLVV